MKERTTISTAHRTSSDKLAAPSPALSSACLPLIVCDSLLALLGLLEEPTTVLLHLASRRVTIAASTLHQHALHLTTLGSLNAEPCLLSCCLPIAEYTAVGGHGQLLFPYRHQAQAQRDLEARVERLTASLTACVVQWLTPHPAVARVHQQAQLWMPEQALWHKASLDGTGISYAVHNGQWVIATPLPAVTDTPQDTPQHTEERTTR